MRPGRGAVAAEVAAFAHYLPFRPSSRWPFEGFRSPKIATRSPGRLKASTASRKAHHARYENEHEFSIYTQRRMVH